MRNSGVVKYTFGFGMLGVLVAMILYEMNARELLVNVMVQGDITINALMTVVILLFLCIGVVIAAAK